MSIFIQIGAIYIVQIGAIVMLAIITLQLYLFDKGFLSVCRPTVRIIAFQAIDPSLTLGRRIDIVVMDIV